MPETTPLKWLADNICLKPVPVMGRYVTFDDVIEVVKK
jgi:hypothetical protein